MQPSKIEPSRLDSRAFVVTQELKYFAVDGLVSIPALQPRDSPMSHSGLLWLLIRQGNFPGPPAGSLVDSDVLAVAFSSLLVREERRFSQEGGILVESAHKESGSVHVLRKEVLDTLVEWLKGNSAACTTDAEAKAARKDLKKKLDSEYAEALNPEYSFYDESDQRVRVSALVGYRFKGNAGKTWHFSRDVSAQFE